jgi:chromosome segregation ATPase
VQNQTELLQQDLNLLRSRMDGLEGIGQRIDSLDQQMTEMQADLQSASDRVDTLSRQVTQMSRQMDTLQAQSDRFEGFLTGLRNLVIALFPGDTNR